MKKIIVNIVLILIIPLYMLSQNSMKSLVKSECENKILSLHNEFTINKKIPDDIYVEFLTALSFFPELKNTRIEVSYKKIPTSMSTRPSFKYLLSKRKNRKYYIFMNPDTSSKVYFKRASFSAQVGCFSHELAHIVHYTNTTTMDLIKEGFLFIFSKKFRRRFETENDEKAAQYGVLYPIYEYSHFIFYEAGISGDYLKFKKQFYYTPEELLKIEIKNK